MKFRNTKGEVIEFLVPAGFVEVKADWHWALLVQNRIPFGAWCRCTDDLHGVARVPSIQEAQSEGQREQLKEAMDAGKYYHDMASASQEVAIKQREEIKRLQDFAEFQRNEKNTITAQLQHLSSTNKSLKRETDLLNFAIAILRDTGQSLKDSFDDFKREAAKSNRNLLEVRDDLRKVIETKSARIEELELATVATTPEQPKGQWWVLSKLELGWVKIFGFQNPREFQTVGYQIKFIPEGEAFLDQEAHELAIRKDERRKCDKENGLVREGIGVLITTIEEMRANAELLTTKVASFHGTKEFWRGKTVAFQYAIAQLKTIVAKDQS